MTLWRLKWWLSGVVAGFTHVVLFDEGHDRPTNRELIGLTGIFWIIAFASLVGTYAAISSGVGVVALVLPLIVGIFWIMATLATCGTAWCLWERYHQTPEERVGVTF